jgi:hypothetical protein
MGLFPSASVPAFRPSYKVSASEKKLLIEEERLLVKTALERGDLVFNETLARLSPEPTKEEMITVFREVMTEKGGLHTGGSTKYGGFPIPDTRNGVRIALLKTLGLC